MIFRSCGFFLKKETALRALLVLFIFLNLCHTRRERRPMRVFLQSFRLAVRCDVATFVADHVYREALALHAPPVDFHQVRHSLFEVRNPVSVVLAQVAPVHCDIRQLAFERFSVHILIKVVQIQLLDLLAGSGMSRVSEDHPEATQRDQE